MLQLFRNFREHKLAVFCVLCLLMVQVFCDLALPRYTADIVDVGIQQGGIARAVPEQMTAETMDGLAQQLTTEQYLLVREAYQENELGIYVLLQEDDVQLEQLEQWLMPVFAQWAGGAEAVKSEALQRQQAILFVQQEYQRIAPDLAADVQMGYLWQMGMYMLGYSLLMMAAAIAVGFLASRVGATIGKNLRQRLFTKVLSFSNGEMNSFSTASLITRSTNDIRQIQMVSVMLLRMVAFAPIMGMGSLIMVASTNSGMSWIIVLALALLFSLVFVLFRFTMPKFKRMQALIDQLNLVAREILTGLSVIRTFSRQRHEEQRFAEANDELMQTQLFTSRAMSTMMPVMMMIMNGITVLIVWVGAHGIDLGTMQVGDMMAFITYTMQVIMSCLMLTMVSIMLPRAGVAVERVEEVLNQEVTVVNCAEPQDEQLAECHGHVVFDDVSFRYPGAEADLLSHISFQALPGQTTAIIGSTGSGKSTLIQLLPRFYDVTQGTITIDGVDIRQLSQHKLRSLLGYVPQKGVLFSGTVASNLKFGGEDISDEAMIKAAEVAQVADFIKEKPDGYQMAIAQGGSNVSGGQKQRLSIARAIASQPQIYLFDDSFSALDYKTDMVLRRALKQYTAQATVIIVAQRTSTILHADWIIVLDEGRIVGEGTHQQLLQECATYQEIARSQLSEQELEGGVLHG